MADENFAQISIDCPTCKAKQKVPVRSPSLTGLHMNKHQRSSEERKRRRDNTTPWSQ